MNTTRICSNPIFSANTQRWAYCYLDGEAEELCQTDIFYANAPKPTEPGVYVLDLVVEHGQVFNCLLNLERDAHGNLAGLVKLR